MKSDCANNNLVIKLFNYILAVVVKLHLTIDFIWCLQLVLPKKVSWAFSTCNSFTRAAAASEWGGGCSLLLPSHFYFPFFHVLLYKHRKYKYCLLPIPMFQVLHHLATEIISHTLFSSPSFKLTVLQLLWCSWLLSPAVKTRGTILKFKFKSLLNKQNPYCLTLNITVL